MPGAHHHVYVVYLRNPRGDGKAAYYVGMTGLTPEQRFQNHKQGTRAAGIGFLKRILVWDKPRDGPQITSAGEHRF